MSETKKLSEERLKSINELVGTLNYVGSKVTELSVEHSRATEAYRHLQEQLEGEKENIRSEYGDVEINLSTGELKKNKQKE
jgi:hypothetical protein